MLKKKRGVLSLVLLGGIGYVVYRYLLKPKTDIHPLSFAIDGLSTLSAILSPGRTITPGVIVWNGTDEVIGIYVSLKDTPDVMTSKWFLGGDHTYIDRGESIVNFDSIVVPDLPGNYKVYCRLNSWGTGLPQEIYFDGYLAGSITIT